MDGPVQNLFFVARAQYKNRRKKQIDKKRTSQLGQILFKIILEFLICYFLMQKETP